MPEYADFYALPREDRWLPNGPWNAGGWDAEVTQAVMALRARIREVSTPVPEHQRIALLMDEHGVSHELNAALDDLRVMAEEFESEWERVVNHVSHLIATRRGAA